MKVKFTNRAKRIVTVAELPKVKEMINDLKEDTGLIDYVNLMAMIATGENASFEVLKAEAEVAKNSQGVGYFADNDLDVWVNAYAFHLVYGFCSLGFYLSNAWQYDGDNGDEIKKRMYFKHYSRDID